MKYDHLVKHNGIYYNAGDEVPTDFPALVETKEDNVPAVVDNAAMEHTDQAGQTEDEKYSKTDINRLSKEDATNLAKKLGLDVGEDESGASIKRRLLEYFDL